MEKILLAGEEIEINLSFENINNVEKHTGSIWGFSKRCAEKTVSISDIVTVYYYMQDGTSYNQEQIFKKIMQDGFMKHIGNVSSVFLPLLVGNQTVENAIAKQQESSEKKPEQEN